jgi:3-deoxy-manno-octulosonate cytidylyltransferase (CMP-KDO synthetase)
LGKALGVIPVRFGSSRFPGKPLAPILGKPMIQWVWEGASGAKHIERIVIATDDDRIEAAAKAFGAETMMTSSSHASGTDRVAEVASRFAAPIVVNIQGDEPLVPSAALDRLVEVLQDPDQAVASLYARVTDLTLLDDANIVKVVADAAGNALYFSRAPLPFGAADFFYQHVGIYGYQRDFLLNFHALPASRLEKAERLEQLRILECGKRIKMIEIERPTLSVDTPQDIIKVEKFLEERAHV